MEFKQYASDYLEKLVKVINNVSIDQLEQVANAFVDAYQNDKIVYIMGN
jgi:hypothetical protein